MRRSLWAVAVALLSMQGCVSINDNTDDCFPLARLRFEYTYNLPLPGEDRFREQVESLDLYAYNQADGSLAASKRYTQADLIKENYSLTLRWLRKGDYFIIAYGNKNDQYYSGNDHQYMPDARMRMICSDGLGTVTENPCHFFYGFTELATDETEEKVVSMIKDTNDIKIKINNKLTRSSTWEEGLPDLTIKIALPNGAIKHDNSIAGDDTRTMTHISLNTFDQYATSLQATVRVGRLFSNDGSTISITGTNSGKEFVTDDKLTRIITDAYAGNGGTLPKDEYLDREDTYVLEYNLEMDNGVLVTTLISVNNWYLKEDPIGGV